MTIADSIKMSAGQFLQLGEDPPGLRLELVDGEIRVSPSPTTVHAYALSQLLQVLGQYIRTNALGVIMSDTDHVLTPNDVRRPDLYFFTRDRIHLIDDDVIRHPPDLAIEIVSDTSAQTDRQTKLLQYQGFGIPHYWIVDPHRRAVEAFRLKRKKYVPAGSARGNASAAFPPLDNCTISLRELWWPPK